MTTSIDLSRLPAPQVVEQLSYNSIRDAMLQKLAELDPGLANLPASDPAYKVLEVAAYRELLVRQDANDKAVHIMLAFAIGTDLDNIGALPWLNTPRLLIDPGDPAAVPPLAPVYESDADYRARLQLAMDGFSTAGPVGAYVYYAKSADGQVKDVSVTQLSESGTASGGDLNSLDDSTRNWAVDDRVGWKLTISAGTGLGQVRTVGANTASQLIPTVAWNIAPDASSDYTLSRDGSVAVTVLSSPLDPNDPTDPARDGTPDAALLAAVDAALSDEYHRPLTDYVTVQAPTIKPFTIAAELTVYPGPGTETVRAEAEAAVKKYAVENHRLGRDITLAGLLGALVVDGVHNVNLISPANDIVNDPTEVSYVDPDPAAAAISVTVSGIGE